MPGAIIILLFCLCLLTGIILTGSQNSGSEPEVQKAVKETLNLPETTITIRNNVPRTGTSSDFSDFQEYIDFSNTSYDLWNYESGIVSLNDFLSPIISFISDNPTGADEIYIYKEYYNVYFDFDDENKESTGETGYKCYSPQECYEITLFMAGNPEFEQIFGGECTPVYDEYEYFCYIECIYDSGEESFAVFHNHQVVFYYQDEKKMELFDKWFEGISEYH